MTKKKSIWAFVLALCLIVPAMFMLTACGHAHTFSKDWTKDATHHWHAATCEHTEEKDSYGEHTFGEWTEKTPADYGKNEVKKRTCTVCGFEDTKEVEGTAHAVEKFTAELYVIPFDESLGIGRKTPIFNNIEVEIFVGDEDNGIVGTITALTGVTDATMIKSGETGAVTITLNSKNTLLSKGLEFVIKEKDKNGNKITTIRGTILSIVEVE